MFRSSMIIIRELYLCLTKMHGATIKISRDIQFFAAFQISFNSMISGGTPKNILRSRKVFRT